MLIRIVTTKQKQMGKAVTDGQFRTLVGGLLTTNDETINIIDGELAQKAIDEMGNGPTRAEFIKWINNGCRLTTVLPNAFTVGDVFRHIAEKGDRRLYLSDSTQNWLIKPFVKKVIPIPATSRKISEHRLPQSMNDSAIQILAGTPGLLEAEEFLLIMYVLIFQPALAKELLGYELKKDKYYICHVMVNGKKVAFCVSWDGGAWYFRDYDFDRNTWSEGCLFLSFATA